MPLPRRWEWVGVGVATARGTSLIHGSTWGRGEWALEAAIVGHSQFLPSFVSEENPLERGTPSPCLKASSSVRHTNFWDLPCLFTPQAFTSFLCLECFSLPTHFPRPSWNVTSSWKASSTPHLSNFPLHFYGNLSLSFNKNRHLSYNLLLFDRSASIISQ